ncbi:MAG: FAD/NAD(P)-binding protein, partial [Phycisphaerales bacterium]
MAEGRTDDGPGLRWTEALPADADVAIVGGGFSGLMTLVHLLRLVPGGRFVVLERRPRALPGPAYGGCDPEHLLNVPAGRIGAFVDD